MENRFQIFTILINQITRSIHKIKTEEMKKFGLKSSHVSCLYYLYKSNGILTSKHLCDMCNEDKALISRSLVELDRKGLCVLNEKTKRYRAPIQLTKEGIRIGKYIEEKIDTLLEEATQGLEEKSREEMYDALELICRNLEGITRRFGGQNDKNIN